MKREMRPILYRWLNIIIVALAVFTAQVSADDIHDAVRKGDLKRVEELVEKHPDVVNERQAGDDRTPLLIAVFSKKKDIAQYLIAHGADMNAYDRYGDSPLSKACEMDDTTFVSMFLAHGANVNDTDRYGATALHSVMYDTGANRMAIIRMLVEHGADVNARTNDGHTPLVLAKSMDAVTYLVEHGADVNVLQYTYCFGNSWTNEKLNYLIARGAKTDVARVEDNDSVPLLIIAVANDDIAAVDTMLARHSDVNARSQHGATPLSTACAVGDTMLIRLLLDHGADINPVHDPKGSRYYRRNVLPLSAALNTKRDFGAVADILLRYGADINARDTYGATPLHLAAQMDRADLVKALIDRHADVNARVEPRDSSTPLHTAMGDDRGVGIAYIDYDPRNIEEAHNPWGDMLDSRMMQYQKTMDSADTEIATMLLAHGANVDARDKEGETPLFYAVSTGRIQSAKFMLEHGANANAKNTKGESPLYNAITSRHHAMVTLLMEHGAHINSKDNQGYTSLHRVAELCDSDAVRMLLLHGADVNARDENSRTPLHIAAIHDLPRNYSYLKLASIISTVRILLENGADATIRDVDGHTADELASIDTVAMLIRSYKIIEEKKNDTLDWRTVDVNARDQDSSTPLLRAIEDGSIEKAELLLNRGADANAKNKYGRYPLLWACLHGDTATALFLLNRGAYINLRDNDGNTSLHQVVRKSETNAEQMVQFLYQHGADVNAQNNKYATPLDIAIANERKDIVAFLLDHHADVNAAIPVGITPLHVAAGMPIETEIKSDSRTGLRAVVVQEEKRRLATFGPDTTHKSIVELLLVHGAVVDSRNGSGATPLMVAAQYGNLDEVKTLVAHGADVNALDLSGRTALDWGILSRRTYDIAKILIENHADVNVQPHTLKGNWQGPSPLHFAAGRSDTALVQMLLTHNADVNVTEGSKRETPLHWAARDWQNRVSKKIMQLLLDHGADPLAKDADGHTPADLIQDDSLKEFILSYNNKK